MLYWRDKMFPFIKIGNYFIPMYGLCIVAGIAVAVVFWIFYAKKNDIVTEDGIILGFSGIGAGIIGAKLFYIVISFSTIDLISLFKEHGWMLIADSGFVYYGGLLLGIAVIFIVSHYSGIQINKCEAGLVPLVPLVHAFGRIGCFFAGCCYGKPTDSLIHIKYTAPLSDAPIGIPLVPIQLYEALFNLILFVFLLYYRKRNSSGTLLMYLCIYAIGRFIMEFLRADKIRGSILGLSTSQIISIAVFVAGITIVLISRVLRKKSDNRNITE